MKSKGYHFQIVAPDKKVIYDSGLHRKRRYSSDALAHGEGLRRLVKMQKYSAVYSINHAQVEIYEAF
jgi:hypothetical protein